MHRMDRFMCWTIMLLGAVACILGTVYSIAEVIRVERAAGLAEKPIGGGGGGSSFKLGAAAGDVVGDRGAASGSALFGVAAGGAAEVDRRQLAVGSSLPEGESEEAARPRAGVAGSGIPEGGGVAGSNHKGRAAAFGNIRQLVDLYSAANQR